MLEKSPETNWLVRKVVSFVWAALGETCVAAPSIVDSNLALDTDATATIARKMVCDIAGIGAMKTLLYCTLPASFDIRHYFLLDIRCALSPAFCCATQPS